MTDDDKIDLVPRSGTAEIEAYRSTGGQVYEYWNNLPKLFGSKNVSQMDQTEVNTVLASFDKGVWTKHTPSDLDRLNQIKQLKSSLEFKFPEFIMDRFKESLSHYVTCEYFSSIVVSAMTAEFIARDILFQQLDNQTKEIWDKLWDKSQDYTTKRLLQEKLIDRGEKTKFDTIRQIRNIFVHELNNLSFLKKSELDEKALKVLNSLIIILKNHYNIEKLNT